VISITNNAASIQLNGDQNVTIVKRDVTKVQSIGINVLIVRKTNGIERKTLIPFSSVNIPQSFSSAQALADYISSILGSFDTSSFIENSNGSYVAQVITSPFIIPDVDLEVNGATFLPVPSAALYDISVVNSDNTPVGSVSGSDILIGGTIVEVDGVNEGSVPAETTAEINLIDQSSNPISPTSVTKTGNVFDVEINLPKDTFLKGIFAATNDIMQTITIDADNAGTYTTLTQDGSSGTITFTVNGSPATLPFTLNIGDTLVATRSLFASLGFYKITGTFV
jgi:hypothetical protein